MSNSAARLDPFDPETYDIFRAALAPPALRTSAARDIATWRATGQDGEPVGDTVSLQEAVWWERAVYVTPFQMGCLMMRHACCVVNFQH